MIRTLGQYGIEEEIGSGGMGVVYRGLDKRLGRQVAIKVLPDSCARDPERRARFEREARLLASLDHPNIGGIYGIEEFEGNCYLILEFVPGQDLAQRLKTGPLPIEEALEIARQVAAGLEAAQECGIIHRDIKPANIRITPEGKVKVLDFGLGKSSQIETAVATADGSNSPTVTVVDSTRSGVILGTAAYMSPEQARGKVVSLRTDIWSFGCVLYEMLAGKRAFRGETTSDFIAAILTKEPDWNALPPETPVNVRALLRRCLEKDPQKRLRHIGDAQLELEEPDSAGAVSAVGNTARHLVLMYILSFALGVLAMAGIGWSIWRRASTSPPVARFNITLPAGEFLPFDHSSQVVLSPDGTRLVYVAARGQQRQLYLRRLDRLEAEPIAGTAGARNPFFSPDGQWLAFFQNFKLKKIALSGGAPVSICDADWLSGGVWGPDDNMVLLRNWRAASGTVERHADHLHQSLQRPPFSR